MDPVDQPLDSGSGAVVAMIVEPEPARKHHGQRRETNRAGEGVEVVEDRDGLCEDEGDKRKAECAAKPCSPVHERIGLQVARVSKYAYEYVLCGYLECDGQ